MTKDLREKIETCRRKGEQWLLSKQAADGAWRGEVDLNPGPTAQVIMLHAFIGRPFPAQLKDKALHYILRTQNEDGGWSTHFGVPSDVSVSCECYVALRLSGLAADAEPCRRAAARIHALGGIVLANPWTQLYCAVLGILPWHKIYKTPVEIMLLPESLPIHVSHFSYWVKAITIPMALLAAVGPGQPIALAPQLQKELAVDPQHFSPPNDSIIAKLLLTFANGLHKVAPGKRQVAIRRAMQAIESFTEDHGDYGGNTCTAMVMLLTKKCMGSETDAAFENGYQCLMGYAHETADEWRMQCCQSHVWDTAFALNALPADHSPYRPAIERGMRWLRDNQITKTVGPWGWRVKAEPGGWCFGDRHQRFPVTDCTAVALLALNRHDPTYAKSKSAELGTHWLEAMQHTNGGWSAYEKYKQGLWMNKLFKFKDIPDALVDVPKGDVSSKVVEALVVNQKKLAESVQTPSLIKSRRFLISLSNEHGLWRGNYGINFIYGTAFAARALREMDGAATSDWADSARQFFLSKQNPDGGWGESPDSYFDASKAGVGASSVVQTAWGILGVAACYRGSNSERKSLMDAIEFLDTKQKPSGEWEERNFLGTVFPGSVYFRYECYPYYFPLMALEAAESSLFS